MKTLIILFFPLLVFGQHVFRPVAGVYYDQVELQEVRVKYYGFSLGVRHEMKQLKWIGTDFGLTWDKENKLIFNLGATIRATVYNNFFGLDLILPRLNMPIEGFHLNEYNTPFGASLRVFPGPVQFKYTGLLYKNAIQSRLNLRYIF